MRLGLGPTKHSLRKSIFFLDFKFTELKKVPQKGEAIFLFPVFCFLFPKVFVFYVFTRDNQEDQIFLAETKFQVYFSLSPLHLPTDKTLRTHELFFCFELTYFIIITKASFCKSYADFIFEIRDRFLNCYKFLRFSKVPHDPGSQDRSFLRLCSRWPTT